MIYLDDADLRRLTGYVKRKKQMEELQRRRIPYDINGKGELVVRADHRKPELAEPELGPVR